MCTIMQNFTPIGVHRRRDICSRTRTYIQRITADLISDKMHTSVAFVDNDTKHRAVSATAELLVATAGHGGSAIACL